MHATRPGTPSTGSHVCAAIMPGRWAAPPAPAMITCTPRSAASRANFAIRSGVRCAETIRCSLGTPSRSSSATQCCIVSQSEALPITTLTRAGADIFFAIKPEAHPFSRSARIATPFLARQSYWVKPRNPLHERMGLQKKPHRRAPALPIEHGRNNSRSTATEKVAPDCEANRVP